METLLQQPVVLWFLAGLVLLLLELVVPGLIILFFGVGGWITALACLFFNIGINTQLFIFLSSSTVSLLLLRRWAMRKIPDSRYTEKTGTGNIEDEYIGKKAIALQGFGAGERGRSASGAPNGVQ